MSETVTGPSHAARELQARAAAHGMSAIGPDFAAHLDSADELARMRDEFVFPVTGSEAKLRTAGQPVVYLCGNSLGLQPKRTRQCVMEELDKWAEYGVEGHFRTTRPWVTVDETVKEASARVVGASALEVVVMNSLTVNLHLMMVAFYRPTPARHKILIEAKAFPSDHYAVESQIKFHGFDPAESLVELRPRAGEPVLRMEDIERALEEQGDGIALVLFSGVQYFTGQAFDLERLTRAARAKGCVVGLDLAHAVGNVELHLHDWGVDFACWCTYKYLNSGPGSIAGCFVHARHAERSDLPRLAGWWGHRKSDRFEMHHEFHPSPGAAGFQLSNPPVLPIAALRASLELFDAATMPRLRAKSVLLTAYLELLLDAELGQSVRIVTPRDAGARGCQLSLRLTARVRAVNEVLGREGVVCDVREPDVMRVAPTPLYNTFQDVFEFVRVLKQALSA